MWDAVVSLLTRPDMVMAYLERGGASAQRDRLNSEVAELKRQRAVRERKITLAREKLLTEIFTDDEYLTVKNQLESEIRNIDKRLGHKEA